MTRTEFHPRRTIEQVEEGTQLAPKFGADGLIPCVTTEAASGDVLMLGWMNEDALRLTLETGEAHYFSRSRTGALAERCDIGPGAARDRSAD